MVCCGSLHWNCLEVKKNPHSILLFILGIFPRFINNYINRHAQTHSHRFDTFYSNIIHGLHNMEKWKKRKLFSSFQITATKLSISGYFYFCLLCTTSIYVYIFLCLFGWNRTKSEWHRRIQWKKKKEIHQGPFNNFRIISLGSFVSFVIQFAFFFSSFFSDMRTYAKWILNITGAISSSFSSLYFYSDLKEMMSE